MFDWLIAFGLTLLAQTSLAHDHALSERPRPTGVAQCEAWPTSPALPDLVEDSLPSLMTMEYRTVYDWDGGRDVAFLGVGHLLPDDEHSWDWSCASFGRSRMMTALRGKSSSMGCTRGSNSNSAPI